MSFREKSSWACLLSTIAIWIPYFVYVFSGFAREGFKAHPSLPALVAATVLSVLLNLAAHLVIAIRARQEKKDERDLAIESRALRNAYYVLLVSVALVVFCPWPWDQLLSLGLIVQVLLAFFVAAETTRFLTQAVCYRRGI